MTERNKARASEETFDEFLDGKGLLGSFQDVAIKRVLAWRIAEAMNEDAAG